MTADKQETLAILARAVARSSRQIFKKIDFVLPYIAHKNNTIFMVDDSGQISDKGHQRTVVNHNLSGQNVDFIPHLSIYIKT